MIDVVVVVGISILSYYMSISYSILIILGVIAFGL